MKKLLVILIIIASGLTVFYFYHQQTPVVHQPLPSPSSDQVSMIEKLYPITINAQTYYYTYQKINNLHHLKLIPNFTDQKTSQELIDQHQCSFLTNGGFYSKEFKPLGWFVADQKQISQSIDSQLFNGFLSIQNQIPSITNFQPQTLPQMGLQTGPILIQNSQPLPLKILKDEPRRRLVVVQTKDNSLLFLIITKTDSLFSGPLMADTPQVVKTIMAKLNISVVHAINLDGGSASVFFNQKVYLKEFSTLGSAFCLGTVLD